MNLASLINEFTTHSNKTDPEYCNNVETALADYLTNLYGDSQDLTELVFRKINEDEDGCCELCYSRSVSYEVDPDDNYFILSETIDENDDGTQTVNIAVT